MALYLRGSTWWYRFTAPDGSWVRESAKTSDKQKAARVEARRMNELFDLHKFGVTPDRPFKDAVSHFLKVKQMEGLRTWRTYEQQLAWWVEQFEGVTLQKVDEAKIVQAVLSKAEQPTHMGETTTPATLNRYLAALSACLHVACASKWIVRVPKVVKYEEPKARVRWLTDDERQRLLDACPEHWRGMIRLSLATGLRQSNVRAMRWEWVDLDSRIVTVPGAQFKNGNELCIPLNEESMSVLLAQHGQHPTYVFSHQGRPISQIGSTQWRLLLERAGIADFRWHDLRHTWATGMARKGVPTHALQRLGGWETLAMVNKYAHHDVESLRQYVDAPPPVAQPPRSKEAVAQIWHNRGKREKGHLRLIA